MSRLPRLVPVLGLAGLVLFLLLLLLFGTPRPATFRFPVKPGRIYDLVLLERPGLREKYSFTIQDQDSQDRDRNVGRYEIRVPNPEGADLQTSYTARPESERALLEQTHLPRLPASPFAQGETTWVTIKEAMPVLQGGAGEKGETGRVVDFSRAAQSVGEGCDAVTAMVRPDGGALAVVRHGGDGYTLEVWVREPDGSWALSSSLAKLTPPIDPVWEGEAVLVLEQQEGVGELRRWRPSAGTPPEPVAAVAGAERLLAASEGLFWLSRGEGEFLLADSTGRAVPFQAHPSLRLLRAYRRSQDAFLVRVPALDREGIDLVLRRRLGESSRLVRPLPESVIAAAASADLAVVVGVERCGNRAE